MPQTASDTASDGRTDGRSFFSVILGQEMPYTVHVPPGYESEPDRRLPVLYMLHGLSGTHEEWTWYDLFQQADALIKAGEIDPLILVLPQGDDSYWVDHADGGPRWGAYTAIDVVREVDARYRTIPDRENRGIGGLSMGADGALQIAMNYPDLFAITIANSSVLRQLDTAPAYFGDYAWFSAHEPISLVQNCPEVAARLAISLDVGLDDPWRPGVEALERQLKAEGIPHAWHEFPGSHDAGYWTARVPDDLKFFNAAIAGLTASLGGP